MNLEYKVVYQYLNDTEMRQYHEVVCAVDAVEAMNKAMAIIQEDTNESFEIVAVVLNGKVVE